MLNTVKNVLISTDKKTLKSTTRKHIMSNLTITLIDGTVSYSQQVEKNGKVAGSVSVGGEITIQNKNKGDQDEVMCFGPFADQQLVIPKGKPVVNCAVNSGAFVFTFHEVGGVDPTGEIVVY